MPKPAIPAIAPQSISRFRVRLCAPVTGVLLLGNSSENVEDEQENENEDEAGTQHNKS